MAAVGRTAGWLRSSRSCCCQHLKKSSNQYLTIEKFYSCIRGHEQLRMSSDKSKITKLITLFRGKIFFGFLSGKTRFFPLYMRITTWIMNCYRLKNCEFTRDNRRRSKWQQELSQYFDVIMAIINMSWLQYRTSYLSNPFLIFGSTHGWVTLWGTWSVQKSMGVIELRFPKAVTPRLVTKSRDWIQVIQIRVKIEFNK